MSSPKLVKARKLSTLVLAACAAGGAWLAGSSGLTGCARAGETDAARTSGLVSAAPGTPSVEGARRTGPVEVGAAATSAGAAAAPDVEALSIATLLKEPPAAGTELRISGLVLQVHTCPPCPPNLACKPCDAWMILGDAEGAMPAESIVVLGNPSLPSLEPHTRRDFTVKWLRAPSQSVTLTTENGTAPLAAELSFVTAP